MTPGTAVCTGREKRPRAGWCMMWGLVYLELAGSAIVSSALHLMPSRLPSNERKQNLGHVLRLYFEHSRCIQWVFVCLLKGRFKVRVLSTYVCRSIYIQYTSILLEPNTFVFCARAHMRTLCFVCFWTGHKRLRDSPPLRPAYLDTKANKIMAQCVMVVFVTYSSCCMIRRLFCL